MLQCLFILSCKHDKVLLSGISPFYLPFNNLKQLLKYLYTFIPGLVEIKVKCSDLAREKFLLDFWPGTNDMDKMAGL